jgi:hypothetical protein
MNFYTFWCVAISMSAALGVLLIVVAADGKPSGHDFIGIAACAILFVTFWPLALIFIAMGIHDARGVS